MISSVASFEARAARIPVHGIGLSVDVFSPDLLELHRALAHAGIPPDYLEIFKAPTRELTRVRTALPGVPLVYHAEGLWLVDPAMRSATPWAQAVETIARHAEAIGAAWANHECAGKQFGGYSFGTYLPPLLTDASAKAVASNAAAAQASLDEWFIQKGRPGAGPLLLLELPPLTYFGFGDLPVSEFFARIVEQAACGLVLDIGHLWTHWRYRERRRFRSPEAFAADFLETFPLDRVAQIHLAGLGLHEKEEAPGQLPLWIDRHDAPVPGVLFDLLRQVLAHPGLTALKGIALEVDTKAVPVIIEEFGRLLEEPACRKALLNEPERTGLPMTVVRERAAESAAQELAGLYGAYARVASGQEALEKSAIASFAESVVAEELRRYATRYLPHELICWGGDLAELFPSLWTSLQKRGVTVTDFVRFWFRQPRPVVAPYDFFDLKLERWAEFVGEVAPDLIAHVEKQAEVLRALHAELNDEPVESSRGMQRR